MIRVSPQPVKHTLNLHQNEQKENNEDLEEANKMDDENHLKAPKLGEHKYRAQLLANLKYLFEYAQE